MSTTPTTEGSARQKGIAALRAGDVATARRLLSEVLARQPDDLEAWLWLSGAVTSDGERRYCLQRVQALDPAHPAAARGLAMLPVVAPVDPLAPPVVPGASLSPSTSALPIAPRDPSDAPALAQRLKPLAVIEPAPPPEPTLPAATPVELLPLPPVPIKKAFEPATEATLSRTPPPPPAASPKRSHWLRWGAVAGVGLTLALLLGIVLLRLRAPVSPQPPAVALADRSGPTQVSAQVASRTALAASRPTRTPVPTATSAPSPTPLPPTVAPTVPPTAVVPGDSSAPALAARGLLRERRDEDQQGAIEDYSAAIALDPTYADAYYLRAGLLYKLGETQSAQDDYARGLQLDSTSAASFYLRGRVEMSRGNEAVGLGAYDKALALDPAYAPAYYSRGVYKEEHYDIQGAIEDYSAAIKADPNFSHAYANRANLYDDTGLRDISRMRAALRDYETAIRLDPLDFQSYFNRGYAYRWYYNQPAKALADFEMAVKLRPTSATAYCELGNVRHKLGDSQGGLDATTQAITIDPNYACAYYTRGRINSDMGNYADAIADYTRYLELGKNDSVNGFIARGVAYAKSGNLEAAIADYTQAIDLNPREPLAYSNRGNCYRSLGKLKQAQDDLTIAADLYRQYGQMDDYARVTATLQEIAGDLD